MHNSRLITIPTQSCLVLYSFCASLLHSLIMWLMVSPLSPHNLHWLFCCVLYIYSCYDMIDPCFMLLSVFLFRFPFLSHFSCVRFLLFVAWNVRTVVFLPIFVFKYFFVLLILVLPVLVLGSVISLPLRLCSLLVVISIYRRYL